MRRRGAMLRRGGHLHGSASHAGTGDMVMSGMRGMSHDRLMSNDRDSGILDTLPGHFTCLQHREPPPLRSNPSNDQLRTPAHARNPEATARRASDLESPRAQPPRAGHPTRNQPRSQTNREAGDPTRNQPRSPTNREAGESEPGTNREARPTAKPAIRPKTNREPRPTEKHRISLAPAPAQCPITSAVDRGHPAGHRPRG